jgi:uncharacterized protein
LLSSYRHALDELLKINASPTDKYGHQPRLYALTQTIGKNLNYDDDVVYAAAYLHDIGVFIGHRPEDPDRLKTWNHVQYTVGIAPRMLREAGFPEDKIEAVLRLIETHQPHDTPETVEATILRDADILEQLGAIGILRAVAKVGRDTRYPTFTPAIEFLKRNLEQLPGKLRLDSARSLAIPRIELLRNFLTSVEEEAQGHLH